MKNNCWLLYIVVSLAISCESPNSLKEVIQDELAKNLRNDSLFLGVQFGMSNKEFYDHCWKINREGMVMQGAENMSVQYLFKDSIDQPITFNFYPEFTNNSANKYKASFAYYAWAPWNRHLYADSMMSALHGILMGWYGGNKPFAIQKKDREVFYKIDGNRAIEYFIADDRKVMVYYYDLTHYNLSETENEIL